MKRQENTPLRVRPESKTMTISNIMSRNQQMFNSTSEISPQLQDELVLQDTNNQTLDQKKEEEYLDTLIQYHKNKDQLLHDSVVHYQE